MITPLSISVTADDIVAATDLNTLKNKINEIYDYSPNTTDIDGDSTTITLFNDMAVQYVEPSTTSTIYSLSFSNFSFPCTFSLDLIISNIYTTGYIIVLLPSDMYVNGSLTYHVSGNSCVVIPRGTPVIINIAIESYDIFITNNSIYSTIDYVDMGFPSGTLWGTMNLGAFSSSDIGLYYAWGDINGYVNGTHTFSASTYKWYNGSAANILKYNSTDLKTNLDTNDDAAFMYTNGLAHIPTLTLINELLYYTTYTLPSTYVRYTSTQNGNYIDIPLSASSYNYTTFNVPGIWSSTLDATGTNWSDNASSDKYTGAACIGPGANGSRNRVRWAGYPIRPVRDAAPFICLVYNTYITLADKSTKPILDITYEDNIYVYDTLNNRYTDAKPIWIMKTQAVDHYVLITFNDETTLKVSRGSDGHCHRLYCPSKSKFILADLLQDKDVMLSNGDIKYIKFIEDKQESTKIYNLITNKYFTFFADNVLTSSGFVNNLSLDNYRSYDEFEPYGISKEMYDGLDLQHTDNSVAQVYEYVKKLNAMKK